MSRTFRPVQEIWGEHSDQFLGHDDVTSVLHAIADHIGSDSAEWTYSNMISIWIEKGKEFLDYLESGEPLLKDLDVELDSEEAEDDENINDLLRNMHNIAIAWRKSLDPKDGSLRFYVD